MPGRLLCAALLSVCCGCGGTRERAAPPRDAANTKASANASTATATPSAPDISADATEREGASSFNQFRFNYKRAGNTAEAVFAPERLPWNDNVVVAAARELIVAAFDDRSENFPRRVEWTREGEMVNAIKLEGERYEYVFLPVEEVRGGTKEARAIKMWQLVKGSVK
ncbi:MAG TPA: hypothetical protein VFX96_07305 [Pyrinomonadaceae bacterium]|nr:hypothetical protein [Pyrinomonadaceae bacterium]